MEKTNCCFSLTVNYHIKLNCIKFQLFFIHLTAYKLYYRIVTKTGGIMAFWVNLYLGLGIPVFYVWGEEQGWEKLLQRYNFLSPFSWPADVFTKIKCKSRNKFWRCDLIIKCGIFWSYYMDWLTMPNDLQCNKNCALHDNYLLLLRNTTSRQLAERICLYTDKFKITNFIVLFS